MAGLGTRFKEQNYEEPKPLVSIMGRPALSYLIGSFSARWKLFFAVGEHFKDTAIEAEILKLRPDAVVKYVPYSERGPIDPVLAMVPLLDSEDSVSVSYCDFAMLWNPDNFDKFVRNSKCNACVVSYRGFHPTYLGPNTYAHLKVDEETNSVIKIKEKSLFTKDIFDEWTSAGFYYFRTVELLQQGLDLQLENQLKSGNEYYTSLAIQSLIAHKKLNVLNYPIAHIVQMGTPEDIQIIQKWYQYLMVDNKKNIFESESNDAKSFSYWKYVFRTLLRSK